MLALFATPLTHAASNDEGVATAEQRQWIEDMKAAPRGPFSRIRWFCADGSVLPPKPYACGERGGGIQHGELNEQAKALRASGFEIANILAEIDAASFLRESDFRQRLGQILIEQFLIQIDDGWILRKARFYRGALQEEDERRGGRELLLALLAEQRLIGRDYALLRSAVGFLPHGVDSQSATRVRQLSASLADRDRDFVQIKNKIHVKPELGDAATVRDYAARVRDAELKKSYLELASAVEQVYGRSSARQAIARFNREARSAPAALKSQLDAVSSAFDANPEPARRFALLGGLLAALRDHLPELKPASQRLAAMDLGLQLEAEMFAIGSQLRDPQFRPSRGMRLRLLGDSIAAIYAAGLVSPRQRAALEQSLERLSAEQVALDVYKRELDQLALVPGWAAQRLQFHFGEAMQRLSSLEPKSTRFFDDTLRGSMLFVYADLLDTLLRDANRMAGVRNELFGEDLGAGLRALNPGLARGRLLPAPGAGQRFAEDGIYILPETEADLPPVAGILTAGEGNPLSHVQ
ncbi:MAG: hypothetical protein KDK91_32905, partial [Gammaproteobacteria bacterium]|nr:hypothetical protein [Gammaproteobacteria bacterium]